ncbi:MAG: alcohol dehydrogenase catalytic domain-containing protein [Desulfohalobiaceae bacterium]
MPVLKPDWALIRLRLAGTCKTDLELMKGSVGFTGVLGHEFLDVVADCQDPAWVDKPVTGEISAAWGQCQWCVQGFGRHCPERTTLGILDHDGCMAEY